MNVERTRDKSVPASAPVESIPVGRRHKMKRKLKEIKEGFLIERKKEIVRM